MPQRQLTIISEDFPVRGVFAISRSSLTSIDVVTVHIEQDGHIGRGECRPYPRYDESVKSVTEQIENVRKHIEEGCSIEYLQILMPAGAARNAVDCALWDLRCKIKGMRIWELTGLAEPQPVATAFTLSVDQPEAMAQKAREADHFSILKLKIGGAQGIECVRAVANARPDARLIIDPNESVLPELLIEFIAAIKEHNIALIEQPCPAFASLSHLPTENSPPLCADEAFHGVQDLDKLWTQGYRAVNIKLDKTGGITEALKSFKAARDKGFQIMAGCMASSSLAVAPMVALSSLADICDLDGPALLANDRIHGLVYKNGNVFPPKAALWG